MFSVLYFHRHENTIHLCTGKARNQVPLLTLLTLLLVEHFLVDICFTIVQVSCQKTFLHFTYSFFGTYNAKFSMLQFPYEKGFDMPGFEIFLLTVVQVVYQIKITWFSEQEKFCNSQRMACS